MSPSTPLSDKLGIRAGSRLIVSGAPIGWVGSVLVLPPGVRVGDLRTRVADVIVVFCRSGGELERTAPVAMRRLPADGALWVAWPKRASGVATDLTEDSVRHAALPRGLVDVKVAALDDVWSGLKLVVRSHLRAKWASDREIRTSTRRPIRR